MRLSWNEIRARAARFAEEWQDAHYERGESQTFYNEFFRVFGVTRRRVASFEEPVKKLGERRGFIDLFWKGVLLVEQKSAGGTLGRAKEQALDYFPGLKEHELPRYVLVSDFRTFILSDLDENTVVQFALDELPAHIEDFGFILGVQKRTFRDQDPVNIQASELMGKLHDALKAAGYVGHNLERLLVRLVFCLFADDTGIFDTRDAFAALMTERTNPDGSDTGLWLSQLFEVLNTPVEQRQQNLDSDLAQFPYVDGDLFEERLTFPSFDSAMRSLLMDALDFSWDAISPAIFGSLFQSVMEKQERRTQGAHYTTERNILKVIEPLFLDELRDEFKHLAQRRDSGRRKAIEVFHQKLSTLRFLDPACGCGNFLIIAYRELRLLEIRERVPADVADGAPRHHRNHRVEIVGHAGNSQDRMLLARRLELDVVAILEAGEHHRPLLDQDVAAPGKLRPAEQADLADADVRVVVPGVRDVPVRVRRGNRTGLNHGPYRPAVEKSPQR